ncbi:hypothetical protein [Cryobacterium sp. AP23]
MSASTQWAPPPAVPADGWNNNAIALRARAVFLWALGILVGSGMLAVALTRTQSLGVLVSWLGFLTATALAVWAIALGSIAAVRAAKLGGYRRGAALTGLLGGIGVLLLAPLVVLLGSLLLLG